LAASASGIFEELDLAFKACPREGGYIDSIFEEEVDTWADFK